MTQNTTSPQAEEPFCWHWENTPTGGMGVVKKNPETLGINMSHPDYKWTALYTAPQPVARKPLSHAQAKALVLKYGNDPLNLVFQVELAHGIKGEQHESRRRNRRTVRLDGGEV